jgi:hypothetical protein
MTEHDFNMWLEGFTEAIVLVNNDMRVSTNVLNYVREKEKEVVYHREELPGPYDWEVKVNGINASDFEVVKK